MPKYKVGDKVKVKDNLAHRSGYCMAGGHHSNSVVPEMLRLRGKTVTIKEAEDAGYHIGEDNGAWCWTDDMFCGAAHSQKYKVGDDDWYPCCHFEYHPEGMACNSPVITYDDFSRILMS